MNATTTLRPIESIRAQLPAPPAVGRGGIRTEIQALRALAVLLVVLYHFWPQRIPGGFVGVDVFFVISGFLITGHLLVEVDRTGTISVSRFWARRVRRLLPASFLVLALSLVATLLLVPADLRVQNLQEIASGAFYAENWRLATDSVDYLAAHNSVSLVQHFWSLGVEEQFYIAWPLVILAVLLIGRRRRFIVWTLLGVGAVSLCWSALQTSSDAGFAYFSTATRAWEFAAGGLLAAAPAFVPRTARTRLVGSWTGLALIAAAAATFSAATPFPGWTALLPVTGACLVIASGTPAGAWSPRALFDNRPVQAVGGWSYGLYLWHWPLLVLATMLVRDLGTRQKAVLLVVAFVAAILSKRFVEDPLRVSSGLLGRRRIAFVGMAVVSAALIVIATTQAQRMDSDRSADWASLDSFANSGGPCVGAQAVVDGCQRPYAVTSTVLPLAAGRDIPWKTGAPAWSEWSCDDPGALLPHCSLHRGGAISTRIAVVGDSHADALLGPIIDWGTARGTAVLPFTHAGCSGFETAGAPGASDACVTWATAMRKELLQRRDLSAVVFNSRASLYRLTPGIATTFFQGLRSNGTRSVVIHDLPESSTGVAVPSCVARQIATYDPCSFPSAATDSFVLAAARASDVPIVDLTDVLCPDGTCHSVIGGLIVYFDSNHLTTSFAHSLAPVLGGRLDRAVPN